MAKTDAQEDFERLPGLFCAWDLARVILPGAIYRIEEAGLTQDGATLFAIYQVVVTAMVH
jgi:hypothetical protein